MSRNYDQIDHLDDYDRKLLENSKKRCQIDFDDARTICEKAGNKLYYENQHNTAADVVNNIINDPTIVFQLVKGLTQAGKTGCMVAIIELCLLNEGCENKLDSRNIFIVTGISSKDWLEQTKGRFPKAFEKNIYHRNELKKLGDRMNERLRNALIIMDEVHIASKEGMSIDKLLKETGLKDMNVLCDRNINVVEFSATPNKVMEDMYKWEKYTAQHVMPPGPGYRGAKYQLENNQVLQSKDLFINYDPDERMTSVNERAKRKKECEPAYNAINEIKQTIIDTYKTPLYHIIRLPVKDKFNCVLGRFKEIFGGNEFEHVPCHSTSDNKEIQKVIKDTPIKHTMIYIKEHLRCAVTLEPKTNLGILYERPSQNDDVVVQGLPGRACGYGVPDSIRVFCNIESLKRMVIVYESGFTKHGDFTYAGKNNRKQKKSFMNQLGYDNTGLVVRADEESGPKPCPKRVLIFKDFKEAKAFGNQHFNHKFNKPPVLAPIVLQVQGKNPTANYLKNRFWGINKKSEVRIVRTDKDEYCMYWSCIDWPLVEEEYNTRIDQHV